MRAEPAAGPAAASAAPGGLPPARSQLRLLGLGVGSLGVLFIIALLAFQMIAARVPEHRAALEELIRHETGLEVSFSELSVHWGWYGPEAVFHEVSVGEPGPGPALRALRLIVALDAWRMVRSGHLEAGRITFINPDIDLSSAARPAAPTAAPGPRESPLDAGARLLSHWRGGRIDLEGGTLRLPARGSALPLVVSLRHAQLRHLEADWSADVRALLPDSLGADTHLQASARGDMTRPQTLQATVRFSGERLVFGGWRAVLRDPELASYLPGAGSGNLTVEAGFVRGTLVRLTGGVRAESLEWQAHSPQSAALRLPRLRGEWQLTQQAGAWLLGAQSVDVGAGPAITSQVLLSADATGTARGVIRGIPLPLLADIARWNAPQLPLAQFGLGGTVTELDFSWDAQRPAGARLQTLAQVQDLVLATMEHDFTLSGLSARISGNDTELLADVAADFAQMSVAGTPPVRLDGLGVAARVRIGADGARWHVQSDDLRIHREGMLLAVRGTLGANAPGDPGRVDAHVALQEADAVMLAGLLGVNTSAAFGIAAAQLTAGRVTNGAFELHGPLYAQPAGASPRGEFRGALEVRDVSLAGDEFWPPVHELSAHLDWQAARVQAAISHARSGSFQLSSARLEWDPRSQRVVRFAARLTGNVQEALQWLREHPDVGGHAPSVRNIDLRGETLLDVDLKMPASQPHPAQARVRVTAVLDGTRLYPVAGLPPVQLLHGTLAFAGGHLQRSSLSGQWLGGPVSLGVSERREHGATTVAIAGRGLLDVHQAVLAAGGSNVDETLTGNAEWNALLSVPTPGDPARSRWSLRADSNLVGVASQLPEPFAKAQDASIPLHLDLQGDDSSAQLRVSLGERLRVLAALTRSADTWRIERGALRLAATAPALPAAPLLSIEGRVGRLELPAYLALWRAAAADAALPGLRAELTATELMLGGRSYPEVRMLGHTAADGGELQLQSPRLSGSLRWPAVIDTQHPARVELSSFEAERMGDLALGAALAAALAPSTRLSIEELKWQGRPLGRFSALVTLPGGGLALSEGRLVGADEELRGTGTCGEGTCRVRFSLESTNAEATLVAYGFRPELSARRAHLQGELHWRDGAQAPLATLSGNLHMQFDEGATHPQARQAQGESFALLVVPALIAGIAPENRAAVQPPLRFTRLAANYELRDGAASTPDLHLDGDAEILVRARVGLFAHDYEGEAFVLRGEERLPVAVRGLQPTPKIAAAWLALREWITGTAAERARIELRLRGTWDDPIVTPAQ